MKVETVVKPALTSSPEPVPEEIYNVDDTEHGSCYTADDFETVILWISRLVDYAEDAYRKCGIQEGGGE